MQRRCRLRHAVGTGQANEIALARRALLQNYNFGVHVVRHGDREKEQHERQADCAPFLEGMPGGTASLMDPASAPNYQEAHSDEHPDDIEK